jgi:hypothetical protein
LLVLMRISATLSSSASTCPAPRWTARRSSAPIFGMRRRRHHLELDGYGVERV